MCVTTKAAAVFNIMKSGTSLSVTLLLGFVLLQSNVQSYDVTPTPITSPAPDNTHAWIPVTMLKYAKDYTVSLFHHRDHDVIVRPTELQNNISRKENNTSLVHENLTPVLLNTTVFPSDERVIHKEGEINRNYSIPEVQVYMYVDSLSNSTIENTSPNDKTNSSHSNELTGVSNTPDTSNPERNSSSLSTDINTQTYQAKVISNTHNYIKQASIMKPVEKWDNQNAQNVTYNELKKSGIAELQNSNILSRVNEEVQSKAHAHQDDSHGHVGSPITDPNATDYSSYEDYSPYDPCNDVTEWLMLSADLEVKDTNGSRALLTLSQQQKQPGCARNETLHLSLYVLGGARPGQRYLVALGEPNICADTGVSTPIGTIKMHGVYGTAQVTGVIEDITKFNGHTIHIKTIDDNKTVACGKAIIQKIVD